MAHLQALPAGGSTAARWTSPAPSPPTRVAMHGLARQCGAQQQPHGDVQHQPRAAVQARVAKSASRVPGGSAGGRGGPQDDKDVHETKLGPGVLPGVKDLGQVKWATATVIRNDAANLGGSIRLLHLSVPDHVDMLYGRRVKGVPDSSRWIDAYTIPGQCIGVRLPSSNGGNGGNGTEPAATPKRLFTIASSPYASRRDSAYVDASIIEIVVERSASPEDCAMAELGPGAQVEVTQVIGRGFSPLLDSYGVLQAIEEGRSLLLIGVGTRGMAALRAVLNWQPVLAHASSHPIGAAYVAQCATAAAFLAEWDGWREAGIKVRPLYTDPATAVEGPAEGAAAGSSAPLSLEPARVQELLEVALFASEGGFEGVCGGSSRNVCILLAGMQGELASKVAKQLNTRGVDYERILFCDYF